ncbi:MAG: mucoidy inhibitor MuiA family protein [Alphaproteobacteria bacterium]|nr:mucoidy inhibitor MuiA family protein [Alphaproteobacteria bacterium]
MQSRRTMFRIVAAGVMAASAAVPTRGARAQAAPQPQVPSRGPVRIDVDARPVAATVYADQATVTRGGRIEIPAGSSVLVLRGVPAGLIADSINASGRTPGRVDIGGVDVRPATFDRSSSHRRRGEIEAALREIDDAVAALEVRQTVYAAQQTMVDRIAAAFVESQRRPPAPTNTTGANDAAPQFIQNPAGWRSAWETVRQGTEEAAEALRRVRLERRDLETRRTALQAELASLGAPPARGTFEIAVAVQAEEATTLDLAVSYQVRGAAWRPVYEARLDTAASRVALRQEAVVTQSTGEDWDDVALTLSTARPSQGTQIPQLSPWRITLTPPAPAPRPPPAMQMMRRSDQPAEPRAGQAAVDALQGRSEVAQREAEIAAATVASAGFAVEYAIPGTASVRSDGTERRVRIAEMPVEAKMLVQIVPRVDRRAMLRASFASPATVPLLPGQASLFLDGVLVGRAPVPMLRPGEELALGFGADDRIRVSYAVQAPRRSEGGGMISGRTVTVTNEAVITVRSFHERPVEVTVVDQAPVSADESLNVTLIADPAPTVRDFEDRPGVHAWIATFEPRGERRIRFGYAITSPRDGTVYGMVR